MSNRGYGQQLHGEEASETGLLFRAQGSASSPVSKLASVPPQMLHPGGLPCFHGG